MPQPTDFRPRSFAFACDIVRLYKRIERTVPYPIARQVLRSGTSIGANLEEAKPSQSRRDLLSRFHVALKEARETSYWLRLILATSLAPKAWIEGPLDEANQFIAILTASVKRLRAEESQGTKLPRPLQEG
jgi:four helix bundle protein